MVCRNIHYYNNERIQVKLKGLSPVQYRARFKLKQSNFLGAAQNDRTFYT
ncbi:hypothetical protein CFY87_01725 [Actinobacillus seminis]|uniref:Integrase catalytic domain-containing protein n=1 Tax=Actinobacillus seminis TaxID=722 RepID=A0ABX4FQ00_9PAST|nr:hypothetical protein CFY87_01725 [Actinobacillus seminis]